MSELDDIQLDSEPQGESFDTGVVRPPGPQRPWLWIVLVLVVVGGVAGFWWWSRSRPEPQPELAAATDQPPARAEPAPEPTPPVEIPPLEESDTFLRDIAERLASSPRLSSWLGVDDLARRFTASVVNLSEGLTPRSHLLHMAPAEPFTVRQRNGEIVPSEKSYARYDAIASAIASLDAEQTVRTYRQIEPLFDQAYAELGYPGRDFDRALIDALDHLLATPVLERDPLLIDEVDVYVYADPELEELSMAQRQLLRTGPENVRRIQGKLAELRRELLATAPD